MFQRPFDPSRRRFVTGVACGSLCAGFAPNLLAAALRGQNGPESLSGNQFQLTIGSQAVNFTGTPALATTVNGSLPAPTLRWREGETVTLKVTNLLGEDTSLHWHGIILPSAMDGVPGISEGFHGIRPGQSFTYTFPVRQHGTFWYHSHSGYQEQTGLYGAIVIDPAEPEPFSYDRDYVVQFSDWTDEDPSAIYRKLKKLSHYYNRAERTHADLMADLRNKGLAATWADRKMWNEMRMSERDLADVTGQTYTYLVNGQTPADGWVGLFKGGETVRLRLVNSSAMTFFDVRIPDLLMTIVAADGNYVEPVTVEELRIGVAETYDVLVHPKGDRAYTLFAQSIDRSGYARGTLTPNAEWRAEVPEMDPVPTLGHGDMGMDHSGMAGMDHSGHDMGAMDHSAHAAPAMDHSAHAAPVMDHSAHTAPAMDHSAHTAPIMDHSAHAAAAAPAMDHSAHNMAGMAHAISAAPTLPETPPRLERMVFNPSDFSPTAVTHKPTEYGPHVDMRADDPRYRLDDPGVGLRDNGRRVLTYADLYNLRANPEPQEPDRELEYHLTGHMGRYMWSIDGVGMADADPLHWKLGELLRITLVNDTMMNHPMHLHGMWSDLETGDNDFLPRKHTIIVQPGSRISFRVKVDSEGAWVWHCHLLYHMLGMFRTIIVS